MSIIQALSATHRPWPRTSFLIPPRTLPLADPSANSTSGRTSITFKRITPISSSCLHYCRVIGSNGQILPCYVSKRSAMSRRPQALPATYRLWLELFSHPSSYSLPVSFSEFSSRIRRNLNQFRENYENVFWLALYLGLLWNPNTIIICMMTAFLMIFIPALVLVVIVALFHGPLWNLNSIIAAIVLIFTAAFSLVAIVAQLVESINVWLVEVWFNLLVSLLIGVGIVVLHATFWKSEKKRADPQHLQSTATAAHYRYPKEAELSSSVGASNK